MTEEKPILPIPYTIPARYSGMTRLAYMRGQYDGFRNVQEGVPPEWHGNKKTEDAYLHGLGDGYRRRLMAVDMMEAADEELDAIEEKEELEAVVQDERVGIVPLVLTLILLLFVMSFVLWAVWRI